MNAGQYEGILNLLAEIRDRMPEPKLTTAAPECPAYDPGPTVLSQNGRPVKLAGLAVAAQRIARMTDDEHKAAASLALYTLSTVLDGWIVGAKENHGALGHSRYENVGEECWRSFAPSDIRNMINDAARELGLSEFPISDDPEEDR
jgi:hypothetical protein